MHFKMSANCILNHKTKLKHEISFPYKNQYDLLLLYYIDLFNNFVLILLYICFLFTVPLFYSYCVNYYKHLARCSRIRIINISNKIE